MRNRDPNDDTVRALRALDQIKTKVATDGENVDLNELDALFMTARACANARKLPRQIPIDLDATLPTTETLNLEK